MKTHLSIIVHYLLNTPPFVSNILALITKLTMSFLLCVLKCSTKTLLQHRTRRIVDQTCDTRQRDCMRSLVQVTVKRNTEKMNYKINTFEQN